MAKDDKQLSLFDRPEAIKQRVRSLSKETRRVLHKELYRLLENRTYHSRSDYEYDQNKQLAWSVNNQHANRLIELYPKEVLVTAIVYFLAEIDGYKRIYNTEKKGVRTYTKAHLLEAERGKPLLVLSRILKESIENTSSYEDEASVVAELLLRNAGYREGVIETFYLGLLGLIGTKKQKEPLDEYKNLIKQGKFGYKMYIIEGSVAKPVKGALLEKIKEDRLHKVTEIKKKIS